MFRRLDDGETRVMPPLDHEPEGLVEHVDSALGSVSRRVAGDPERFSQFIGERGRQTDAWRGEVHQRQVGDQR